MRSTPKPPSERKGAQRQEVKEMIEKTAAKIEQKKPPKRSYVRKLKQTPSSSTSSSNLPQRARLPPPPLLIKPGPGGGSPQISFTPAATTASNPSKSPPGTSKSKLGARARIAKKIGLKTGRVFIS